MTSLHFSYIISFVFRKFLKDTLILSAFSSVSRATFGLAWAQSIVSVVEIAILLTILHVRTPGIFNRKTLRSIITMMIASAIMGVVTYFVVQMLQLQSRDMNFMAVFPKFTVIVVVSFAVYIALSKVFKLEEADPIVAKLRQLLFGRVRR